MAAELHKCPKHDRQMPLNIQEDILLSGDRRFRMKCVVCGKLGPRRKTMYGARCAWNEDVQKGAT